MLERWNTHFSTTVEQELFGIDFQLAQDPNSSNLGTTVWDASIVLAKYIEKNSRRGDYSRPKVRGKQVLELGAGMGLAGMAMAMLGADVAFTDIGAVLPLLQRNVDQNISTAALKVKDAAWAAAEVGSARVASLDWSDPSCYSAFKPPYDFILAADCVYSELAVPHLLATVLHMSGPRTHTIITNELRSQTVHDLFTRHFGQHFTIRKVPANKMDPNYQHNLIHIYLLKRRKQPLDGSPAAPADGCQAAQATGATAGEQNKAVQEAGGLVQQVGESAPEAGSSIGIAAAPANVAAGEAASEEDRGDVGQTAAEPAISLPVTPAAAMETAGHGGEDPATDRCINTCAAWKVGRGGSCEGQLKTLSL